MTNEQYEHIMRELNKCGCELCAESSDSLVQLKSRNDCVTAKVNEMLDCTFNHSELVGRLGELRAILEKEIK